MAFNHDTVASVHTHFQIRTVLSSDPEAMQFPFGDTSLQLRMRFTQQKSDILSPPHSPLLDYTPPLN